MASVYRSNDAVFYNSKCLFIEYHDIIKVPWFVLLNICRQNQKLNEVLDFSPVQHLTLNGLFEWYVNRKNRNIFYELAINKNTPIETFDKIVDDQLCISSIFFDTDTSLTIVPTVKKLLTETLVKEIVVYSEVYSKFIETDIKNIFGGDKRIKYLHGNINEVLNTVPIDTTYFFSNIDNVVSLDETNHLDMSSIVLPHEYRYNKNSENKWNVDLVYLAKDHTFKVSYYNACYE